jgi:hypothetical protein
MSSFYSVRIPLTIPESVQSKNYTVKFSAHLLSQDGEYDEERPIFLEQTFGPSNLLDGPAGQKIAIVKAGGISWSGGLMKDKEVGLKVSKHELRNPYTDCDLGICMERKQGGTDD